MATAKKTLTSVDEFEKLYFPRAYQEKISQSDENTSQELGIAVDLLGELQRQLPKKKARRTTNN